MYVNIFDNTKEKTVLKVEVDNFVLPREGEIIEVDASDKLGISYRVTWITHSLLWDHENGGEDKRIQHVTLYGDPVGKAHKLTKEQRGRAAKQ